MESCSGKVFVIEILTLVPLTGFRTAFRNKCRVDVGDDPRKVDSGEGAAAVAVK